MEVWDDFTDQNGDVWRAVVQYAYECIYCISFQVSLF